MTGLEDAEMMKQKLGEERFNLCMQLYAYFEDVFRVATGDLNLDRQRVINAGNDFKNKRLVHLRLEVNDLRQRIINLEKFMNSSTIQS